VVAGLHFFCPNLKTVNHKNKKAWDQNLSEIEVSPNTHAPNKISPRRWRERLTFSWCLKIGDFRLQEKS
jgi:hypothetical protein